MKERMGRVCLKGSWLHEYRAHRFINVRPEFCTHSLWSIERNSKCDVTSSEVCNGGPYDVMTAFCVNKFPPMTAAYHKSAKAYSLNAMDHQINHWADPEQASKKKQNKKTKKNPELRTCAPVGHRKVKVRVVCLFLADLNGVWVSL